MFLEGYGGNRITVNRFTMGMPKVSRVLGRGKNRLAVVFDLEIVGDKDVEYDISRQRIVGQGRVAVMLALESALRDDFAIPGS